jgi:hypothetical protein
VFSIIHGHTRLGTLVSNDKTDSFEIDGALGGKAGGGGGFQSL